MRHKKLPNCGPAPSISLSSHPRQDKSLLNGQQSLEQLQKSRSNPVSTCPISLAGCILTYDIYSDKVLDLHLSSEPLTVHECTLPSNLEYTLDQHFFQRVLPYLQVHKRSWKLDYGLYIGHLQPTLGHLPIHRIDACDIHLIQHNGLSDGYAPSTVNRWLVLLRHIISLLVRWKLISADSSPMQYVSMLHVHNTPETFLTQEQLSLLLQAADSSPNTYLMPIIQLLILTGARKREILDARWDCVDLLHDELTVPLSKSGHARHILLSQAAKNIISSLPRSNDSPWLFPNPHTGKPYSSIYYAWNTLRISIGMPNLRMHDLRHSFASFCVNEGRSLYEVQQLLGHSSPKTTMRYAHLSRKQLMSAISSVSEIVRRAQLAT